MQIAAINIRDSVLIRLICQEQQRSHEIYPIQTARRLILERLAQTAPLTKADQQAVALEQVIKEHRAIMQRPKNLKAPRKHRRKENHR